MSNTNPKFDNLNYQDRCGLSFKYWIQNPKAKPGTITDSNVDFPKMPFHNYQPKAFIDSH